VRREADATDRRVNRVFLEPKSKQLIARNAQDQPSHERADPRRPDDGKLESTALTLDAMKRNLLGYLQGNGVPASATG